METDLRHATVTDAQLTLKQSNTANEDRRLLSGNEGSMARLNTSFNPSDNYKLKKRPIYQHNN